MPLTPEDVANKQFTSTRLKPGYDETEVDEFLDEVEAELTRLYRENDELRSKLSAAGRGGETAQQAPVVAQPAAPDPALARENDELRQKLAAAQRQLAEAANRPQPAAPTPVQPAAPAPAQQAAPSETATGHPGPGAAHRRRAHRRGAHPGRAHHRRGHDPGRPAQAGGRGQAPPDDRLAGDRAVHARARGREAALVRAGVPQPAQVLPRGPAARARRPVDRRAGGRTAVASRSQGQPAPAQAAPAQQGQRSPFAPGAPVGGGDQPSGPPQQPQGFTEG